MGKKKKRKSIDCKQLAVQAVIDLIIGTILIVLDKILN